MGKDKRQLHPADQWRKKEKRKNLKRNKDNRRNHREELLSKRTPEDILREIHQINRKNAAGNADDKLLARKNILIEGHKAALAAIKEREKQRKEAAEAEPVVIKGMGKIFRQTKAKPAATPALKEPEVQMLTMDESAQEEVSEGMVMEPEVVDASAFYTKDDEDAMVFDDELIAEYEEEFLEVPPGINAPPGIKPRVITPMNPHMRPGVPFRGAPPIAIRPHGNGQHPAPVYVGPKLPQQPKPQEPEKPKDTPKPKAPVDPLNPVKKMAVDNKSTVQAKAQKPQAAISAAMAAFVPTALMVKRKQPKPVIRPRRKKTNQGDNRENDEENNTRSLRCIHEGDGITCG